MRMCTAMDPGLSLFNKAYLSSTVSVELIQKGLCPLVDLRS